MGLLDKILGRDWKFYLKKSDKCVENQDLGEAMACIRKAQELANDDQFVLEEIKESESKLKKLIYTKAYEQAKTYLKGGQHEAAQNALDRAARYVQTEEERNALNELTEAGNHWQEEEKVIEAKVEGEEHVSNLDTNDKWNLYVGSLPYAKAQHFDDLGDAFKSAWIALQEGAFDEAVEGLEKVYAEHADDALVMCELGRAYYGKGDLDKAEEILEKSDNANADIDTKLIRTEVMWAKKKFDVAETILQSAHDMDPENIQVLARIAQHGLIAKDYESGIAAAEVLLEMLPQDISIQRLAGRLYQANGDEDKALECYETVNRIYWQVNPQTHKLAFDQNSAMAAANIYLKRGENLKRCAELLDAVRANSEGETHVAICLQLAECYEKMGKPAKKEELLGESRRFMDDMFDTLKGPEKAMLQMQYSEVCEDLGDKEAAESNLMAARDFFVADAERGVPVASFYASLIDKKINGEPFPKGEELQKQLMSFVEELKEKMQRARENQGASFSPAASFVTTSVAESAVSSTDESNMRAMAKLAQSTNNLSYVTLVDPNEGDESDGDDSSDADASESADADEADK